MFIICTSLIMPKLNNVIFNTYRLHYMYVRVVLIVWAVKKNNKKKF